MMEIEAHIWSNFVVVLLLAGLGSLVRLVRRQRLWHEAAVELWQRRRLAIVVVGLYLLIGIFDSIAWKGGFPEGSGDRLPNAPLSLLDRAFLDTREASYSAPLAEVEFYGGRRCNKNLSK